MAAPPGVQRKLSPRNKFYFCTLPALCRQKAYFLAAKGGRQRAEVKFVTGREIMLDPRRGGSGRGIADDDDDDDDDDVDDDDAFNRSGVRWRRPGPYACG